MFYLLVEMFTKVTGTLVPSLEEDGAFLSACQIAEMTENMWNSQIIAFADDQIPNAENPSQSMLHKT